MVCMNIRNNDTTIAIAPKMADMAMLSLWKLKSWLSKRGVSLISRSSNVELHCGQPILGVSMS